ncbi:GNAT family N-acetyltransferase [Acinetobacter sp. TSRC1-2]
MKIAWRLEQKYWGNGFATKAATACLKFVFD